MRIRRTLSPTAAPLRPADLWRGLKGFFAGEKYLRRLKEEITGYFGVRHAWFTSSGKAALYVILRALRSLEPDRTEVLIPAYTCFSVPSAIVRAGLEVALCDIDASSLDLNGTLLGKSVNEKTLCVVPDHLFGIPSAMGSIVDLCRDRGVFVLEDAAQAMGGRCDGRFLGTIGDVGLFSLGRGKPVACGSGGIIITASDVIAGAIEREFSSLPFPGRATQAGEYLKAAAMSLFIHPLLYSLPAALPFLHLGQTVFDSRFPVMRFSSMQAGLCMTWRRRLEAAMSVRKRQAAMLCRMLDAARIAGDVSSAGYLRLPFMTESRERRQRVCRTAKKLGLGITTMYPSPVNEIPQIAHRFAGSTFPAARLVADRLITLPLHRYVRDGDREEMARLLKPVRSIGVRSGVLSVDMTVPGMTGKERV
ncbi:MAG TPA: DegT/DnrJ/EryC1/StrS family aminotransferase [Syntrophorhabdaceae bacterium]|nr:DegT/DnrJ/EryC1/StrS family aminotransferase [Syntrophorhabdaceae bacterium]HOD75179.1 DegT/DnrJ/EryC1/StrS family aminotransferase [Syntrophorhabdaceae bacterium]